MATIATAAAALANALHAAQSQEPVAAREVSFTTPRAEIAGTFLRPAATNRVQCAVIIGGTLSQTRDGAHISTGYEVPFDQDACILIFKSERSTTEEKEFIEYLKGMAARLQRQQQAGQEKFLLKDLPAGHPARKFAREVNPAFERVSPRANTINFDQNSVGQAPAGWTVAITGEGAPDWRVEADASAPSAPQVLRQSAETPKTSFPLCLKDDSVLKDGFVEVRFKTVSGKIDQAAGVVWRAKDRANYYVCRANALEDNVVLYRVENRKRQALDIVGRAGGYGVAIKVARAQWHTLRVELAGPCFRVLFNGQELFAVEDATFPEAGAVGLWTKADSVTLFDDFSYGEK